MRIILFLSGYNYRNSLAKAAAETSPKSTILFFGDETGRKIDLHLRGSEAEVLARLVEQFAPLVTEEDLRVCFFYGAAIAFFISGPMQVAIPLLAVKLTEASAVGLLGWLVSPT